MVYRGSSPLIKAKAVTSANNVIAFVSLHSKDVLIIDYLSKSEIKNDKYYTNLLDSLNVVICAHLSKKNNGII